MLREVRLGSLLMGCAVLLLMSSRTAPTAYCQGCPEANIGDAASIKCLAGENARCESGPKCDCSGRADKDNECGGACSISTNWGACSIQCRKGVHARCVPGRKIWVGLQQRLIPPVCQCGGPGMVGMTPPTKGNGNYLFADVAYSFNEESLRGITSNGK